MVKYYFVTTALPPLSLEKKPELSFKEVREILKLNLAAADWEKIHLLLRPLDLYNIRAHWLDLPLDDRANLKGKELEEVLLVRDLLPAYLVDFLDRYESKEERLRYFPSLYASLYREGVLCEGFLARYFSFEREVRLLLTALRAKQRGRDLIKELQFEDPQDPFVAYLLAQKEAPDLFVPLEHQPLKALFLEQEKEPSKLHLALLEYRFRKIEEMEENEHFTMDCILGYLARLLLVEALFSQDREKGRAIMEELSQYG